jgi:hypothetical protein
MAWRRRAAASAEIVGAAAKFRLVFERINDARDSLLLGVPSGRAPLLPLAEALAGFEAGLATASEEMPEWRTADLEPEWLACRSALDRAMTAAEGLRLGESPQGYEAMAPLLDEVLEPLDAFDAAARRFRRLGAAI